MILILAAVFLFISKPAHAYIDAGSGSYALQIAIAFLLGSVFSAKLYWAKVKASVRGLFVKGDAQLQPKRNELS